MASSPPRPDAASPAKNERSLPSSPDAKKGVRTSSPTPDQPEPAAEADPSASADGIIDMETFRQILDLDEDDSHEFSAGMAWAYFDQAATTFTEMEAALAAKDLAKLSSLGHFLKGSSAALGVAKVQASCERMQHLGQRRDEEANADLKPEEALERIDRLLVKVKKEYNDAEQWLRNWYKEHGVEQEPA